MKTKLPLAILVLVGVAASALAQPAFIENVPRASANFTAAGDLVYFTSFDSLFRTDGTEEGTFLIRSGFAFESTPRLMPFNDVLIFIVRTDNDSNGFTDREMWRSDGTVAGTYRLAISNDIDFSFLGTLGNKMYFGARDPSVGGELFKTDGTASGTTLVMDIRPGGEGSFPGALTNVGNTLFFHADDGVNGRELWKTDGTPAGTLLVKDINPGSAGGIGATTSAAFNNKLYFSGVTDEAGTEPWLSDGTDAGTVMLKDILPGDSAFQIIEYALALDGSLYFFASSTLSDEPDNALSHVELWRTDGSSTGTNHLKTFSTTCAFCGVNDYRIYEDRLYFFLQEGPERDVLYSTDGTATGTIPVFSLGGNGAFIGEMNGELIFSDIGLYEHNVIYRTDGTVTGTEPIRRMVNVEFWTVGDIVKINDRIYFADHDVPFDPFSGGGYPTENLYQLMQSDGLTARSIRSMGGGSYYGTQNLVELNGSLIFTTHEPFPRESGIYRKKLWIFDPSQPFESLGTFTLVNADTDEDIRTLTGGEVVSKPADTNFNIRFDPPGSPASVVFRHQGKVVRRENAAPFALGGDRSGDYIPWQAGTAGYHKILATPYSEAGGNGTPGTPVLLTFTIVEGTAQCAATGTISREHWAKVQGAKVSDIPLASTPTSISALTSFEGPQNIGTNYGARIRGFICPPQTGNYTFWIASNDHSELWISADHDPANRQRIAWVTGATDFRQWNKFTSQRSAPVHLMEGKKYFIEALHKQGVGTDHLSVGWQLPDGTMERPIAGERLSPFDETGVNESYLLLPADGSTAIDPLVVKLEAERVESASTYTVMLSDEADFSGEPIVMTSAEAGQREFIVKGLKSGTTYYSRVSVDGAGFGPTKSFTTRDAIARLRLWGMGTYGGADNVGTIFSYSIDDNAFVKHYDQPLIWYEDYYNEERLRGSLIPGPDGVFYGHREHDYSADMFQMDAQGNVTWWNNSAYFSESQLFLASNNYIYATSTDNWVPGIVDKYDVNNQTLLLEERMHFFTQFSDPNTPLIEPGDGYLYGAAGEGGVNQGGFIYKFRLDGSDYKIIHYFHDEEMGMGPYAGLVEHNGFLYGTTTRAGAHGFGTIFRIKPDGTDFATIHDFDGTHGAEPRAELLVVGNVLFGTTDSGGALGYGTVFSIQADGSSFSVLHGFDGNDGADPSRGVVSDGQGNLYGMTTHGGGNNMGVIYKVRTDGTGFTKLYDLSPQSGGVPDGVLVIREDTYQHLNSSMGADARLASVTVHPNPSDDRFTINIDSWNGEKIQLVMSDQYGNEVSRYDMNDGPQMQFGGELKRGLYLLKVIVEGKTMEVHRIVKK